MTSGPSRADELLGLVCLESNRIRLIRPYDLSQHAKDVINERDNQLSWLEQVLEWPELVEADADDPQVTHYVGRIAEYGNRPLRVVLNARANPARIVTVYFDRKMKGRL